MYKLIFLDIETHKLQKWQNLTQQLREAFVNHYYKEEDDVYFEENWQEFFKKEPVYDENYSKFIHLKNIEYQFNKKSGLIAELGRVICVSIGIEGVDEQLRVMCFKGPNELEILNKLAKILDKLGTEEYGIAGWNTNGFDIPFLCKRYIINGLHPPILINPIGLKPWERLDRDVMQLWKCSGYQSTSLELACASLNFPVKFTNHTGKDLWEIELNDMNWEEVEMYCNNDMYSSYLIYKHLDNVGYL